MTADAEIDPYESEYVRRPEALGYIRVLEVLREWDPIGVFDADHKGPRDEYDGYAAPIVRMLDSGKSREEIVQHLGLIAMEYIGLSDFDQLRTTRCVMDLIEFWQSWTTWKDRSGSRDTSLDSVAWHILDATASDWESLDQIEPHVCGYCAEVDRVEVATRIIEFLRINLLNEMNHRGPGFESAQADDLLRQPTRYWFGMSGIGKMLWKINRARIVG